MRRLGINERKANREVLCKSKLQKEKRNKADVSNTPVTDKNLMLVNYMLTNFEDQNMQIKI